MANNGIQEKLCWLDEKMSVSSEDEGSEPATPQPTISFFEDRSMPDSPPCSPLPYVIFSKPICVFYIHLSELDFSEPESDNDIEIWDEEEDHALDELDVAEETAAPVVDVPLESTTTSLRSHALSQWLLYVLMFMQATIKLSESVLLFFFRFLAVFLSVLGQFSTVVQEIAQSLPSSLQVARQARKELIFQRYVVCRRCHRIFPFSECIEGQGVSQRSKNCSYVAFPLHPQQHMRNFCGTLLLKTVELATGRTYFYPFLTYCYLNIDISLQSFLDRPDFYNQCEHWRARKRQDDIYRDVYDGKRISTAQWLSFSFRTR